MKTLTTRKQTEGRSVRDRLRETLRDVLRFEEISANRRWGPEAMRRAVIAQYASEEELAALRARIEGHPDPGSLPALIRKIKREVLASPHYGSLVPPSKVGQLLYLWPNWQEHRDDMARFQTDISRVYALCVLETVRDSPEVFGGNDDPVATAKEMAALGERVQAQKADLAEHWRAEDVTFKPVFGTDGKKYLAGFYAITAGEVPVGDAEGLITWGRQHVKDLGL